MVGLPASHMFPILLIGKRHVIIRGDGIQMHNKRVKRQAFRILAIAALSSHVGM